MAQGESGEEANARRDRTTQKSSRSFRFVIFHNSKKKQFLEKQIKEAQCGSCKGCNRLVSYSIRNQVKSNNSVPGGRRENIQELWAPRLQQLRSWSHHEAKKRAQVSRLLRLDPQGRRPRHPPRASIKYKEDCPANYRERI